MSRLQHLILADGISDLSAFGTGNGHFEQHGYKYFRISHHVVHLFAERSGTEIQRALPFGILDQHGRTVAVCQDVLAARRCNFIVALCCGKAQVRASVQEHIVKDKFVRINLAGLPWRWLEGAQIASVKILQKRVIRVQVGCLARKNEDISAVLRKLFQFIGQSR